MLGGRLTQIADSAANRLAYERAKEFIGDTQLNILRAFKTRVAMGEPVDSIMLTPQEVFDSKIVDEQNLNFLRIWFEENGLNFDQLARDYYKAVEAAPPDKKGSIWLLDNPSLMGFAQTVANQINRATFANRPQAPSPKARLAQLFLGYGANENSQGSLMHSRPTKNAKKLQEFANWGRFFVPAFILRVLLMTTVASYIINKISEAIYRKKRPQKMLSDVESAEDLKDAVGYAVGPVTPVISQVANTMVSSGPPGRGFMGTNLQLLPMAFLSAALQSIKQMVQTGSFIRPFTQAMLQWIPFPLGPIINNMPYMEGIASVNMDVNTQRAHTPSSIELRKPITGEVKYSPAWSQLQQMKNEIGKEVQDGAAQDAIRQEGAAKYAAKGNPDPFGAFDKAFLAVGNKYLMTYGRELTQAEKDKIDSKKSPDEKAESDRIDANVQAYAQRYGDPVPDFVKNEKGGGSGGAGLPSTRPIAVGAGGGGGGGGGGSGGLGGNGTERGLAGSGGGSGAGRAPGAPRVRTGRATGLRKLRGGYGLRRISASPRAVKVRGINAPKGRGTVKVKSLRSIKL